MLHPALAQALAAAHAEDLHRAAAAARLGQAELPVVRSASIRLRGRRAPQGRRHDTNREFPHGQTIRRRRPLIAGVKPREGQAGVRRT